MLFFVLSKICFIFPDFFIINLPFLIYKLKIIRFKLMTL